jgi:hypothetical protein
MNSKAKQRAHDVAWIRKFAEERLGTVGKTIGATIANELEKTPLEGETPPAEAGVEPGAEAES